jgi:hypothetical protein
MKKAKHKMGKKAAPDVNAEQEDTFQLRQLYQNQEEIIDHLAEIPVNLQTYEFLGELFFNCTFRELGEQPPTDQWKAQLKAIRNDVYQLFELARAARALRQENENNQQP